MLYFRMELNVVFWMLKDYIFRNKNIWIMELFVDNSDLVFKNIYFFFKDEDYILVVIFFFFF